MRKYLVHHFHDVLSSQGRRNWYEKMTTDPQLSTTIILASDYSALMDGHSQDQLNQTTQLHSLQLVILLSYLCGTVLKTSAYSFWHQQGTTKLKSDNHYYRQCKDRVLSDARAKSIIFDRVVEITDGAPTQFKNRFNMIQLGDVVRKYDLLWAMAVYPPTATFKGEHDGVGNLDKNVIRQAELNETGRYPTTRNYMPLLWSQPDKTPRALDDPQRRTHEIDEHVRILVNDLPNVLQGDTTNCRMVITNKAEENYECSNVPGIQSCYNAIVFKNSLENGAVNTNQTVYLKDAFCSCDNCRGVTRPEDFLHCRYLNNNISILVFSPDPLSCHLISPHPLSTHLISSLIVSLLILSHLLSPRPLLSPLSSSSLISSDIISLHLITPQPLSYHVSSFSFISSRLILSHRS
jgi:hypothetical protein